MINNDVALSLPQSLANALAVAVTLNDRGSPMVTVSVIGGNAPAPTPKASCLSEEGLFVEITLSHAKVCTPFV